LLPKERSTTAVRRYNAGAAEYVKYRVKVEFNQILPNPVDDGAFATLVSSRRKWIVERANVCVVKQSQLNLEYILSFPKYITVSCRFAFVVGQF
jgi:hypothetical protein